jgi:hypothetical protein
VAFIALSASASLCRSDNRKPEQKGRTPHWFTNVRNFAMTDDKTKRDNIDRKKTAGGGEVDYLVDREGHVFKAREPDHGTTDDREGSRSPR